MRLINPSVEIIPQEEGLLGVYKQIERAGRTCYKSEDKITENSAIDFTGKMIHNGHTAMLEHGTVYLKVPNVEWWRDQHEWEDMFPEGCPWIKINTDDLNHYITTNYRHIAMRGMGSDLLDKYMCEPTDAFEKRVTVRFICDRGIMAELTRHRAFSFAVESTRYCNYSRDKFNNQLTFIIPSWADLKEGNYCIDIVDSFYVWTVDGEYLNTQAADVSIELFLNGLRYEETCYMRLLKEGMSPQQARQVLPNALKTEVVMTGFVSDWEYFFSLRCAPNAHPDMQYLAKQLKEKFAENKILTTE